MSSLTVSYITKKLLIILFVAALVITPNMVRAAQEPTEEEYKAFQDIQAEKDSLKKTDMIVKFLKEKPKSSYRPNVINEFQRIMVDLQKEKKWAQIISLGDKFIDVVPNDAITVRLLAAAYSETKNVKGFATFGEKAYAASPNGQLAAAIAKAYLQLGNEAKFLAWGEKALASDPDNVEMLSEMTRKALAAQNTAQALKYARDSLKVLPTAKKPEGIDAQTWQNTVNTGYATAYATIGANAYQNKNYAEAIKNLDSAVKYSKRNETAYYFLGVSYWQENKLEPAMLNFAKAYILKGSTAAASKKYLDQLWMSGHRNSLAGEERVIDRAQQDLK
jgi:tetratricopeptide (TPR) repeat protein